MLPSTIPSPVWPPCQTRGALTLFTFHSIVFGEAGAILAGEVGRTVERTHGLGTMRLTSARAARASTTARPPVTVRASTMKCDR